MTTARLPDGTELNFPDGTPPDVIQRVVKQHLGAPADGGLQAPQAQASPVTAAAAPAPSIGDEALRQAKLTGRYALEGLSSVPNMVGDAANSGINVLSHTLNSALGTNIPMLQMPSAVTEQTMDRTLGKPQNGTERVVGEASKMLASVPAMAGTAAKAVDMGLTGLRPLAENLGQQAAGAIGGGGLLGVTKEATDNPVAQAAAATVGSLVGGGASALGAARAEANAARAAIPSTQAIKNASQAAYRESERAGAIIRPETMQNLNRSVISDLTDFGYDPALQPRIGVLINRLNDAGNGNITAKGIDTVRKIATGISKDGNPSEQDAANHVIGRIDDMMTSLTPADVVQGNSTQATQSLMQARDLWKTFRKSELIDNLAVKGEDQAMSTNSGGNVQNAIRQKLRGILDDPKKGKYFEPEERAAIRQVVRGTPTQNSLRLLGRLAPSSNAWLGILSTFAGGTGGGATGMAAGVAVPVIGSAAKAAGTALTNRAVRNISEMVRSQGRAPIAAGPDYAATLSRALAPRMIQPGLGIGYPSPSLSGAVPATADEDQDN